ncbi:carbohydrate sulfotransferase 11 isoform X2 [Eurytemora carolleeae]|nr:carbohydrate sulfotransferase 11 isoform X2 [Eurytemora carolleeae]|eukprot:XP_023337415.1 carbohydrate sulfotransferase 11-like isoform X2 [Eurytemora affinis]
MTDNEYSCSYESKVPKFSQQISKYNFLQDPKTSTVLCFNYKIAASSWMDYLARVENNVEYLEQLREHGKLYEITKRLGLSESSIFAASVDNAIFKLLVVRNPFERIISAYANRILDQSTAQYKENIIWMHKPSGELYKIGDTPTLSDFIVYVTEGNNDPHWKPVWSSCSPCLVQYTAVLKLEDGEVGIDKVLADSGLIKHAQWDYKPKNKSNKTGLSFRDVDCMIIEKLYRHYQLDFMLFQYNLTMYLSNINKRCTFL